MTATLTPNLTLDEFLKQQDLERSPAWEYVNGQAAQKPMPKFRHSLLQKRLLKEIDDPSGSYLTLPELRCTFGGRSIVPDIVVISWQKIAFNERGEPEDHFTQPPDWAIEILSPDQSTNRVIDNILYCLHQGGQLGWLIDPNDYSVLILEPGQELKVCRGNQPLKVLSEMNVDLTAETIFSWLQINNPSRR